MYKLSRLLLILAVFAFGYAAAAIALHSGPLGCLVLIVAVAVIAKRRRLVQLSSHGTARWANATELRNAGMLEATTGLSVGHLTEQKPIRIGAAIIGLFRRAIGDKQACEGIQAALKKTTPNSLVRLSRAIHIAVFSPSGGGKGVSIVIPFLLRSCPSSSCVVIDLKGENALLTASHRQKAFGQQVVLLDPFKQVTQTPDCLNVLDAIDKDNPHALDDCRDCAKALVMRTGDEKEPHWNDAAEIWLTAVIAVVVFYGDRKEGTRSLQTVRDILSNPQKLDMSIKLLLESNLCGGLLARMGGGLTNFIDKEKSSVLTTVSRHLRFLDTPAIVESTKTSSFDPALLRSGKLTVYLILPPNHMQAQAALLRVWITAMLRAVVAGGLQEHNLTYLILDEAASLGHLDAIDDAVDKYRGYGLRLIFLFQSLGQLHKCFPQGQEQTLLSNTTKVFFGTNDKDTADYVSAMLGDETLIVKSGGTSTSRSSNWSHGPGQASRGGGTSSTENENWQPQARKLLQPSEVVNLPPRVAITFHPGVPPICTWLTRYYEKDPRQSIPGPVRRSLAACSTLAFAACMFGLGGRLAALVSSRTLELRGERQTQSRQVDRPGVPADQSIQHPRRFYVRRGK